MSRHFPPCGARVSMTLLALVIFTGCLPQQPFHFFSDGDLSHYREVATEIEYPDADQASLGEVTGNLRPLSLDNPNPREVWALSLEEAIRISLENSKVLRSLGGRISPVPQGIDTRVPNLLVAGADRVPTVYDPATTEANPRFGTEAALAAFDTQFTTNVFWEKNNEPRNPLTFFGSTDIFPRVAKEDVGNFQAQLQKTAATGGTWVLRHNVAYSKQNTSRLFTSDWNVNLQAEFRQPLLQGGGVEFNRIAGPGAIPGFNSGIMIARINTDIVLADFEAGVQNLVSDVEGAYWELYFAYRALDAVIAGRDSALQFWRQAEVELRVGTRAAHEEAQARQQYFLFKATMERTLNSLYEAEANLRYIMGLASTDGRLIRPSDEPTAAKVAFDWAEVQNEGLCRNVQVRRQKWNIKRRELELAAAKNYLLPRLDAIGRYTWLGLGDDLFNQNSRTDSQFDSAYSSLTTGDFQDWHLGLEMSVPIGFRREMSGVRFAQLSLAREQVVLQEQELELTHQLGFAIREMESSLVQAQTNFNRRIAAKDEVRTAIAKFEAGVVEGTLDRVLDAQRRLAEAESDYYRTLVNYNKAIANVHLIKGSLLEYNGVCLAEGPWPAKAYFDARRLARARDAGMYLDYGFTRPRVISRGSYQQFAGAPGTTADGTIVEGDQPIGEQAEQVPTPAPLPAEPSNQPMPKALQREAAPAESPISEPKAPIPSTRSQGTSGGAMSQSIQEPKRLSKSRGSVPASKASYDLGTNLGRLADKPVSRQTASADGWAKAKSTGDREPVRQASHETAEPRAAQPQSGGWTAPKTSGVKALQPVRQAD